MTYTRVGPVAGIGGSQYAVIKQLPLLMHCLPCNRDEVTSSPSRSRNMLYHRHQIIFRFWTVSAIANGPESQLLSQEVYMLSASSCAATVCITLESFQV